MTPTRIFSTCKLKILRNDMCKLQFWKISPEAFLHFLFFPKIFLDFANLHISPPSNHFLSLALSLLAEMKDLSDGIHLIGSMGRRCNLSHTFISKTCMHHMAHFTTNKTYAVATAACTCLLILFFVLLFSFGYLGLKWYI